MVEIVVGVLAAVAAVGINVAVGLMAHAVNFDIFWWLRR